MASIRRMGPEPSLAQVRDYVLTMLEGLSSLAETVDDQQTSDRVRAFADQLMMSWSPKSQALLRRDFGRLDELVALHAAEQPDAPAAALGERVLTYAELDRVTDRLAAALQRDGLDKGDIIAICAAASLEYVALILAASRVGVVIAPLAGWLNPDTLAHLVEDSGARRLFTDDPALASAAGAPAVMFADLDRWMAPPGARPKPVDVRAEDPHCIMYTSGATGAPKGVVQTYMHRWRLLTVIGATHRESYLVSTPLCSSVTTFAWSKPMAVGGTSVLMAKFDALEFLRLAERWRITNAVLAPVQAQRILAHPEFDRFDLSSFRAKVLLAAPSTPELKAEMLRRWPGGLVEVYAMSEGGVASYLDAVAHPDKLHTVGRPQAGVTLKAIDEEGAELEPGSIGELVGRSKTMMKGYHNRPEATERAFWRDAEGKAYVRSGDLGRIDPDGFVELLGRKKDMIVSGGQNIYPRDLEAALERHPAVQDAAVVGRRSERWGEEPVAFVTLNPGWAADPKDLHDWMCERLGRWQRPAEVIILDELPMSPVGKVLKAELRARLEAA
ncbi:MAG: class I adenylate-forming enzyme family protein [Caulobacteraceae bacterium]